MSKVSKGAKNLFNIALNAAKGVDQSVPKDISEARIEMCNNCTKLSAIRQCKECLCFVDAKTKIKQEECPLLKWSKYTGE